MFTDPQSVTINAIANSLPRTSVEGTTGAFTKDDGTVDLRISHQAGRRFRRSARLHTKKIAADPYQTSINTEVDMSVTIVIDVPKQGYTIAEQKQAVDGFLAYLSASSGAKITQLLGGEI